MNIVSDAVPPTDPYIVHGVEPGHPVVDAWSVKLLPFEPKGVDLEFKVALRQAILQLGAAPGDVLHAVYASEVDSKADAENILFYNVGTSSFQPLTQFGLRFERAYVAPPTVRGVEHPYLHYHRYWLSARVDGFRHWDKGQIVARFQAKAIANVAELHAPSSIWYRVKRGEHQVKHGAATLDQGYGVSIAIRKPANSSLSLASIVKPVLDGVISAFHTHNGTKLDDVSERLGTKLGIATAEARRLLLDEQLNLLGPRNLVWPFSKGIQWNPADDRCVAAELLIGDTRTESGWELSGELFAVSRKTATFA